MKCGNKNFKIQILEVLNTKSNWMDTRHLQQQIENMEVIVYIYIDMWIKTLKIPDIEGITHKTLFYR